MRVLRSCLATSAGGSALEYSGANIRRLEYKRISLKTDQEPALVSLANAVISQRDEETILEHSQ
eukprot:11351436-Heterocapsa_arctica.AAC.1